MDAKLDSSLHFRTSEMIRRLRQIDMRLGRVTSNLCGPVPESGETAMQKPGEESLHEKFYAVERLVSSLEDEMSRLENVVGSHQPITTKPAQSAAY